MSTVATDLDRRIRDRLAARGAGAPASIDDRIRRRLAAREEAGFSEWYAGHAQQQGLDPDPDAPEHFYDYRAAFKAGAGPDESGHWPSQFKRPGHPNRYVDGIDTITGEPEPQAPGLPEFEHGPLDARGEPLAPPMRELGDTPDLTPERLAELGARISAAVSVLPQPDRDAMQARWESIGGRLTAGPVREQLQPDPMRAGYQQAGLLPQAAGAVAAPFAAGLDLAEGSWRSLFNALAEQAGFSGVPSIEERKAFGLSGAGTEAIGLGLEAQEVAGGLAEAAPAPVRMAGGLVGSLPPLAVDPVGLGSAAVAGPAGPASRGLLGLRRVVAAIESRAGAQAGRAVERILSSTTSVGAFSAADAAMRQDWTDPVTAIANIAEAAEHGALLGAALGAGGAGAAARGEAVAGRRVAEGRQAVRDAAEAHGRGREAEYARRTEQPDQGDPVGPPARGNASAEGAPPPGGPLVRAVDEMPATAPEMGRAPEPQKQAVPPRVDQIAEPGAEVVQPQRGAPDDVRVSGEEGAAAAGPGGQMHRGGAEAPGAAREGVAPAAEHKYSTTQLDLPEDIAGEVRSRAAKIADEDLAPDGREAAPHVTVKYGIEGDDAAAVARALEGQGPITVRLGKTSLFKSPEHDVVKIDVHSQQLRDLNKRLREAVPNVETQPEYKPHVTLGYVKPGRGAKYEGDRSFIGREITIDRLTFSDRQGKTTVIPLQGGRAAPPGPAAGAGRRSSRTEPGTPAAPPASGTGSTASAPAGPRPAPASAPRTGVLDPASSSVKGTPGKAEQLFRRVGDEALARIKARGAGALKRGPGGTRPGSGQLDVRDVVDGGLFLAAKFAETSTRFLRKQRGYARKLIAEHMPHLQDRFEDVFRLAGRVLRESKAEEGKYREDLFEAAVAKVQTEASGPARPVKTRVREATGQVRTEEKTVTAAESLVAGLKKSERAARVAHREGVRAGLAKARESLRTLLERASDRAAGKADTARGIKDEIARLVRENLPPHLRGRYVDAVAKAETLPHLRTVIGRLRRDVVKAEVKGPLREVERVTEKDIKGLEPEWQRDARVAIGEIAHLRRLIQRAAERPTDELELIRDDLVAAVNTVKALLHQQKTIDDIRIGGEKVEAKTFRDEFRRHLRSMPALPTSERPGPADVGRLRRFARERTNWGDLMESLDGFKPGGPAGRLWRRVLEGRRRALELSQRFEDEFGAIVKRHGYKSLGQFTAELSGTLGRGMQKTVDVPVGPHGKITLGQAAYLYAAMRDAGVQRRLRAGQPWQFRDAPTGHPFKIRGATLVKIADALPENVKKIIDEGKAAYDRQFFAKMSAVNKRMKGQFLEKVAGYWGIKLNRAFSESRGTPRSWSAAVIRAWEESGFMQERLGPSGTPMVIGDFGTDIMLRAKSAATVIGKAETTKALVRTLLHKDVMPELAQRFGQSAVERLERRISLYSGGEMFREANHPLLRTLQGNWARSKTQLWAPTWARNAAAGSVKILDELGAGGLRDIGGLLTHPPTVAEFRELQAYSPELRERWSGRGLSSFYDANAQADAAHFGLAMKATMTNLAGMVRAARKLSPGDMAEAARSGGASWAAVLDAVKIGNYFDAMPAIVAYRYFLRLAPKHLEAEARKRWAARHATRAFERTSNTATVEYANDVQLNARESMLLQSFLPFTGDTAKSQSMIYRAWNKGAKRRVRTAAVVGLSAGASAAITALYVLATGEKAEEAGGAGATRLAQEFLNLIPGVGLIASQAVGKAMSGSRGSVTPELDIPIVEMANKFLAGVGKIVQAVEAGDDVFTRGPRRGESKALAAVLDGAGKLLEVGGEASGIPVQYVRAVMKGITNWRDGDE